MHLGFHPKLVPTLIAVPGVVLLLGLGTWQVMRLAEKNALNAWRIERTAAAAVPLAARVGDVAALEFRRVVVSGSLRHDSELHLNARSQRGNAGYHILTPLIRADGPPVLINRGWVPYERKDPARRAEGQVAGAVTVEGILRREPRHGLFMPDNDAARNEWFWYDLPAMAVATRLADLAPFYVEAGTVANPGGFPIGGQTIIELPSNHIQYAITWYALAVALAVIYVMWHRQQQS
ncbi:MAG: SURF1 family protein [Proteobacteria bacterium]|nr:SURF1 family protein [Pseudomonadota bacterium]